MSKDEITIRYTDGEEITISPEDWERAAAEQEAQAQEAIEQLKTIPAFAAMFADESDQ